MANKRLPPHNEEVSGSWFSGKKYGYTRTPVGHGVPQETEPMVSIKSLRSILASALALSACVAAPAFAAQTERITPEEARALAKEAYVYGYPIVKNYGVLYTYFTDRGNAEYKGPWNALYNEARLYTPDDKAFPTPNADTPYSQLGADLRTEPLVLSVPKVEAGRYYALQFVDLYTYNFAYVGSRATGNGAGDYLLVGPHWKGAVPRGIRSAIRSETDLAFVFYRTQLIGAPDMDNVKRVQAGYKVQPLSTYLHQAAPAPAPAIPFVKPALAGEERDAQKFFSVLNFVLQFCPTHRDEAELRQRMTRLGIVPGQPFPYADMPVDIRKAIDDGVSDAWQDFDALGKRVAAGEVPTTALLGSRETLGNHYLYRMRGAATGLYGNSREETIYPPFYVDASGQRLDGAAHRYVLHFPPGQLPPVNAFWSFTMYDARTRMLVANPLNRYLVNSPMLPSLARDADGGLTLYVQHDSPGPERESNWLPAPEGPFVVAGRLYWPKPEVLSGAWKAPKLQRVD